MRSLFRKALLWCYPSLSLGDRAFVDAAALRADLAAMSLRLRVAEQRLAEWERQAKALTQVVALHSRDLAWLSAQPVQQLGSLSARIAAIELLVMQPLDDTLGTNERFEETLAQVMVMGEGEVKS